MTERQTRKENITHDWEEGVLSREQRGAADGGFEPKHRNPYIRDETASERERQTMREEEEETRYGYNFLFELTEIIFLGGCSVLYFALLIFYKCKTVLRI